MDSKSTAVSAFAITTSTTSVKLDGNRKAQVAFTVSNQLNTPLQARARIAAKENARSEWFKIAGEAERQFTLNGTQQFTVQINVPKEVKPGKYGVSLDVSSTRSPDEESASGPVVAFEVAAPEVKKQGLPGWWWIPLVVLGVLIVAVIVFLVVKPKSGTPTATPTASATPTRAEAYKAAVLADKPVAYYPMDEAQGKTFHDASTTGADAIASGGVTAGSSAGPGSPADHAAQFDGSTGYVTLPSDAFKGWDPPTNAPLTVELWFKTDRPGVILGQTGQFSPGSTGNGWVPALYVDNQSHLRSEVFWHNSAQQITAYRTDVADGHWHYLAVTVSGGFEVLYLDGAKVQSQAVTQNSYGVGRYFYFLGTGFTSGWPNTNGNWFYFPGQIQEVAVYNTALSSGSIQTHYTSGGGQVKP